MIFSAPLFTVLLSLIVFRIRIGLLKGGLCLVLFGGVILNVKPPFIFPQNSNDTILWNLTLANQDFETASSSRTHPHTGQYYVGVALALGCSLSGSLKAIVISHIRSEIDSLALGTLLKWRPRKKLDFFCPLPLVHISDCFSL